MKAILMSGPAGSGKSTWASNYIASHNNTVIVSSDSTRFNMYGRFVLASEEEKTIIPDMMKQIERAANNRQDVIVDIAINKNKSRLRWYNKLRPLYKDVELIIIEVPIEVCLQQNAERDRHVPENVIQDMYAMIEEPTTDMYKQFSKIIKIKRA